jgi:hypothetical protein
MNVEARLWMICSFGAPIITNVSVQPNLILVSLSVTARRDRGISGTIVPSPVRKVGDVL